MMTHQQEAFKKAVITGEDHVVLKAYAGTGKTTTIQWTAEDLPSSAAITLCAFNKRIVVELDSRISRENIYIKTFNGMGHGAWMRKATGRVKLNQWKNWDACKALKLKDEEFPDLPKAMAIGKAHGMVPSTAKPNANSLIPDDPDVWIELFDEFDIEVGLCADPVNVVRDALCWSIKEAWRGNIDYDDQLYMSAMFRAEFRRADFVFVDEAQDLSMIQRHMATQLLKPNGKFIAVGDPHQAIYAFRGADSQSIPRIVAQFDATVLPLSVSFRCPKMIVEAAQQFVPDIEWADKCSEGSVIHHEEEYTPDLFLPGDVILCRNNAPLISTCFRLIKHGKKASVLGREIGQGLIKMLDQWDDELATDKLLGEMWDYISSQAEIYRKKNRPGKAAFLIDKGECIEAVALQLGPGSTKGQVCANINQIFSNDRAPITLSTVHKAKGMEWKRVYILDSWLIGKRAETAAQQQQEDNLHYVAITRSQDVLTYINSDDLRA